MHLPKLLLDAQESAEFIGTSLRKFHELRKDSSFPLPVELGPRAVRWRSADLAEFVAALPAVRRSEPAQLRRGRLAQAAEA